MFKREMLTNFKNFIIWTSILIVMFLIVFLIYPSIMNSENIQMIDEMIKIFPKEVLIALNMDVSSIDSAFGWLKSEGFILVLLITGIYSAIMGSNILLKEEDDKTIEYLNSLPIKRNNIVINKILSGYIYIILMILILGIFNFIGLCFIEKFDIKLYILLSITPLFSSIVIFSLCLFLSTLTRKTKKMTGISLGIIFLSYFIQIISELSSKVEFLKYFSIFTLADNRNVIINQEINIIMIFTSLLLSIIFIILTLLKYNKKEFL